VTPRSRNTARSRSAEPDEPDNVSEIADARVALDLDAEATEQRDPFTFRLGGQDWTVPCPSIGQTLDAEQAPYLSDFFEVVLGEELWEEFEPVFRSQRDPNLCWKLAQGMSRHFGMDPESIEKAVASSEGGNRAQRRAARGRPRRA